MAQGQEGGQAAASTVKTESVELLNQLVGVLAGSDGHRSGVASLLPEDTAKLPQALASLCSSGNRELNAFRRQDQLANSDPAKEAAAHARSTADVDVDSILAGVRGAIGQSIAHVKRTAQSQGSLGSMGPSTSQAEDDSVNGSDDQTDMHGSQSKKSKSSGLPPAGPSSMSLSKSLDNIEVPPGLSAEESKKYKRRISNRECARRIRQKRQEQLLNLGGRIETLKVENAKLMIRLTEVMKCWHEIKSENRILKAQMLQFKNGGDRDKGISQTANALAHILSSALGNSQNGGNQAMLMKAMGKDTHSDKMQADALRGFMGQQGSKDAEKAPNGLDFSILTGQASSDLSSQGPSAQLNPDLLMSLGHSNLL
mmetsp:Transcript_14677/g.41284  ORF Transcript_14677/g.41284 Transcript_14677/m.41284 type:complete len:369 (-) Transcript_14677:359-1465(-)|eukprot:CAMPEP_0117664446 /NCGR_PEP_ID=MMETSP0804-20121206/9225_1 /TAXON_ID=1074897 /ORGANISM="Tetraselmis astigmatica, Strain CCMP880" /LENGTH=368 /DNA_ID=CAMNT_0005471681 /DNA_START=139 /DNA_END=1245 /DNA_ORIENTATION=-